MYTNCDDIFRLTIPAIRIAVARELKARHGMGQARIARVLGVSQAKVSNYLGGKYSGELAMVAAFLERKGMQRRIASTAASGSVDITALLDSVASSKAVVRYAISVMESSRPNKAVSVAVRRA